ncbi:transposase, IS605 OrfB family protein [Microseira wollei NIES-4236]|uniref:Transposase, IS605 OrfB family protein n=1 Tax=Microseira wollei NIES-4236 TaxID=2530354 RepID=A0AAV3XPE2_9CYAN|nr:transposase, IS605 OrfB family protein [Microseira wollei NIES-4236]
MDAPKETKINYARLCNHVTELRNTYPFVKDLNVHAGQASAERAWLAISRFYDNCKAKKPGKKGYPKFQKDNRKRRVQNVRMEVASYPTSHNFQRQERDWLP